MSTTRQRRSGGLRHQWRSALTLMIGVLVLALSGVFVSYVQVVDHYRTAADGLDHAITLSSQLTDEITGHEAIAHTLWNGGVVDRQLYVKQQNDITDLGQRGTHLLRNNDEKLLLDHAMQTWRFVLVSRGLWGPSAAPRIGVTVDLQQQFGSDSDEVTVTLSKLSKVAIADGSREIAGSHALQNLLFGLLIVLFALIFAVTAYFARRMTLDVLDPIESLHRAVIKIREGDLQHRVRLRSRAHANELSELADALNSMAGELDKSHKDLSREATHDSLTGLLNRAAFEKKIGQLFRPDDLRRPDDVTVLFIDVDDFKFVNDSHGHAAGDKVLVAVATCLSGCIREGDLIARLGGDEFAVLVLDRGDGSDPAVAVAQRVLDALVRPFAVEDHHVRVAVSIGIAARTPQTPAPDDLLAAADFAMYAAKALGKNRYQIFEPSMRDAVTARATE